MSRTLKTYDGETRRYVTDNLMCTWCGNTHTFNIDLKLKQNIHVKNGQIEISLCKTNTLETLNAIKKNMDDFVEKCYDGLEGTFYCANCEQIETLDYHERVLDYCYNYGCYGCFQCQNFITKNEMLEFCRKCIHENTGKVDEEYCDTMCPISDFGLREIHHHYDTSLWEIRTGV